MNMSAWWLYCKDEDDTRFYRYHIVKNHQVLTWLADQRGCTYQIHDVDDREPEKEFNTDILGPLLKNLSELDQKILRLRHAQGLKWQTVSDQLGYNLSYLWKREKRAMEKLRAIIDREGLSPWRDDEND